MKVLHCTFAAMVADHFVGEHVVNTEHTRAPLLLFKGLDAILEDLETDNDSVWTSSQRGLPSSPVFRVLLTDHYCRRFCIALSRLAHPSCPLHTEVTTRGTQKRAGSGQHLARVARIRARLQVHQGEGATTL